MLGDVHLHDDEMMMLMLLLCLFTCAVIVAVAVVVVISGTSGAAVMIIKTSTRESTRPALCFLVNIIAARELRIVNNFFFGEGNGW